MQQPGKANQPIKGLFLYLREIVRFHDVGTPQFVQVLFVLMLAVLFGSILLLAPYVARMDILYQGILNRLAESSDNEAAVRALASMLTADKQAELVSTFGAILGYTLVARLLAQGMAVLYGYVWHLKHMSPDVTVHQGLRAFFFRLPRLLAVNLLFYGALLIAGVAISLVFGVLGFFVPIFAVLLYVLIPILYLVVTALFAFRDLSVLSGRTGVLETFRVSWKLTAGSRRTVIGNMVLLYVLGMLISSIAGGNSAGSPVAAFVVTFLDVIMFLVTQRLVVRMYEDARGMQPGVPVPAKTE